MPKRTDISSILTTGAGPTITGQACARRSSVPRINQFYPRPFEVAGVPRRECCVVGEGLCGELDVDHLRLAGLHFGHRGNAPVNIGVRAVETPCLAVVARLKSIEP